AVRCEQCDRCMALFAIAFDVFGQHGYLGSQSLSTLSDRGEGEVFTISDPGDVRLERVVVAVVLPLRELLRDVEWEDRVSHESFPFRLSIMARLMSIAASA